MLSCSSSDTKALPKEYRKAAEDLFPPGFSAPFSSSSENSAPLQTAILDFAEKLGVGNDYRKVDLNWKDTKELEHFLFSFRNNLELLIQKTWIEKADEDRKEKLLNRVPGFITVIKEGDYAKALGEFGSILEELAWLLFGFQSHKGDFYDYVFRMDHQWGLFWWYGGQLGQFLSKGTKDEKTLQAVLLLGLCYLTDF